MKIMQGTIDTIASFDAPNHKCCRCRNDKKAKVFKYGAFFCGEECAERASGYTLDSGQACVPNYYHDLNELHKVILNLNSDMRYMFNDNLWEALSCVGEYYDLINLDSVINATAPERARALEKTIKSWTTKKR